MYILFAVLLLILYLAGTKNLAPLRVLAIAWAISVVPILLGLISFSYLSLNDWQFPLTLIGFLSCFVLGAVLSDLNTRTPHLMVPSPGDIELTREFEASRTAANLCWWIAMTGTLLMCLDFFALQGAGLDDIAALRDTYVDKSEASTFARVGSVMTWACLYCFGFALTYRLQLRMAAFALHVVPIGGFFLLSVFSAGRQASFQIMMFTILILWMNRKRSLTRRRGRIGKGAIISAMTLSAAMIAYMGYIAVARNNANISDDKVVVLTTLFDLKLNPGFDQVLLALGTGLRTTVVEGVVYFSSSIALFSKFLTIDFPSHSMGAVTFPFVFRQLQSFTGIDVIEAYLAKVNAMGSMGVIGVGWETGISSYLQDFGTFGAGGFLFLEGYYTAYAWRRAFITQGFNEGMIAVITLVAVMYMPLIAAASDTNIFILWIFCIFAAQRNTRFRRRKVPDGMQLNIAASTK